MRHFIILCSLPFLLSGCAGALLTTGAQAGVAVAENRSIGRKVDDTVIYTDLTNQFIQADQAALLGHVTFNVRFSRVMLTGNVKSEADAQQAVVLSWKAKGVTEVINELVVNPDNSLLDTAGDAIVKRNLETRLLITKGVWVINYSIDVNDGTAYIIGRVKDKTELDKALNIARTTKGIKRVVSHLQINADTQHPIAAPDGSGSSAVLSSSNSSSNNSGPVDVETGPVYGSSSLNNTTSTVGPPDAISTAPLGAPKAAATGGKPLGSPTPAANANAPVNGGY